MIDYVRGELTELSPAMAVVEAGGVGYALGISLNTFSAIQGKKDVRLWAVQVIREDAHLLFGFANRKERELFLLLTSVSGIGAGTARVALSAMTPSDLATVISSGDERSLKSIKGIGPKAAQRIIVELKDKVMGLVGSDGAGASPVAVDQGVLTEAVAALTALGFSPAPSQKAAQALLKDDPQLPVEQVIKRALKML